MKRLMYPIGSNHCAALSAATELLRPNRCIKASTPREEKKQKPETRQTVRTNVLRRRYI